MTHTKKAVLFITNLHLWSIEKGKGGKAFYNCVQHYLNTDWEVFLISSGGNIPNEFIDKLKVFEKQYTSLDKLIENGIRPISILSKYIKRFLLNRFYIKTANYIINNNTNRKFVVYAYEVDAVAAAKNVSKNHSLPLVTRFQGTILSKLNFNWYNRFTQSVHFNALSTKSDIVIMTNDGTQGDSVLKQLNNNSNKIFFLRNGVDQIDINELPNRDTLRSKFNFGNDKIFVTVSRLIGWKRVHLAIEAFHKLSLTIKGVKLVIIGDGEEAHNLKELSKNLGIDNKVIFLGAIEQSLVTEYLHASDIFLSLYDLSNLGNPIMEAMRVGKPIITIDVGDTKELIKNNINGILLPNHNFELIPESMLKLINDEELSMKLSLGAKKTADDEFWSWSQRMNFEFKEVSALIP